MQKRKGIKMNVIETGGLSKQYKRYQKKEGISGSIKGLFKREYTVKKAVDQFDLNVQDGEFVGLIGANGAGKTTLVKMLTGIIAPTSGKIRVLGFEPNKLENEFKRKYAIVMGQKSQLFFELTAEDTLRLYKEIYGIPEDDFQKSKAYFVQLFGVEDLMNVQVYACGPRKKRMYCPWSLRC